MGTLHEPGQRWHPAQRESCCWMPVGAWGEAGVKSGGLPQASCFDGVFQLRKAAHMHSHLVIGL